MTGEQESKLGPINIDRYERLNSIAASDYRRDTQRLLLELRAGRLRFAKQYATATNLKFVKRCGRLCQIAQQLTLADHPRLEATHAVFKAALLANPAEREEVIRLMAGIPS